VRTCPNQPFALSRDRDYRSGGLYFLTARTKGKPGLVEEWQLLQSI
jgi:hypothetical protein